MSKIYSFKVADWLSKGFFYTPSKSENPNPQKPRVNSTSFSPLSNTKIFSLKLNQYISSSIPSLLFFSRPTAITFGVLSIIINSVQSCIRYSMFFYVRKIRFIHIGFEICKRFPRAFNTASTILRVIGAFRVVASSKNISINSTKSRSFQSMFSVHTRKIASRLRQLAILITSRNLVGNFNYKVS